MINSGSTTPDFTYPIREEESSVADEGVPNAYLDLANRDFTTFRDDLSHQTPHADDLEDVHSCSTITELEVVYLDSGEKQVELHPCRSPRWTVGLSQGSRWRFEVSVRGDLDPDLHRWSRLILSEPTPTGLEPTNPTVDLIFSMDDLFDDEESTYPLNLSGELEFEVTVTGEHNFTSSEKKLDSLFKDNNYKRMFISHTHVDAWYVQHDF